MRQACILPYDLNFVGNMSRRVLMEFVTPCIDITSYIRLQIILSARLKDLSPAVVFVT